MKYYLFGIDKAYQNPGTEIDLKCEPNAMKNYSSGKSPTISRLLSKNTFLSQDDEVILQSFKSVQATVRFGLEKASMLFNFGEVAVRSKLVQMGMFFQKIDVTPTSEADVSQENSLLLLCNKPANGAV
ncbi:MAG: hypothetical protein QNK11_04460 [Legionella sp.]|nr:hypothetical protein [Legionella sp.]